MVSPNVKNAIDVLAGADFTQLTRPGVTSRQLVWPGNSPNARVTVTRVTVAPGGEQPRHAHANAEQTWIIEQARK